MDAADSNPECTKQHRSVRVFVSSTFLDLMAERDYLARHTFPQLRELCRSRQVEFTEVDLRWGITEKQSRQGQILPICLREIHECHPYFIGILAERYGWKPSIEEIDDQLLESHQWLRKQVQERKSVTELEIVHGVLNIPEMKKRALFYFRQERMQQKRSRSRYMDDDSQDRKKLIALKHRIREGRYQLLDGFSSPRELGDRILHDLWIRIDKDFPASETLDELSRQSREHHAFAQHVARSFVDRPGYFDRLDQHANSDSSPLLLIGPSGIGKTAIIAAWALRYRSIHPEIPLLLHFFGVTPESTKVDLFLLRVIQEIRNRWAPEMLLPDTPGELRNQFPSFLKRIPPNIRMILVLDGLNQLTEQSLNLRWLPERIPANIRVVASTAGETIVAILLKRSWSLLEITPLLPEERIAVAQKYLALYTKKPEPWFEKKLYKAPQAANPLYLRILLDEMRLIGTYARLKEIFNQYLKARTVPALYNLVLARLEEDYQQPRHPDIVKDTLCLLWAAPRGLREIELRQLLGSIGRPLPGLFWSPLYNALCESLVSHDGMLAFSHDYLRQSIHKRYLKNPHAEFKVYMRLAEYFESMFDHFNKEREEYRALSLAAPEAALALAVNYGLTGLEARACCAIAGAEISAAVGVSSASDRHFDRAWRMAKRASDLAKMHPIPDVLAVSLRLRCCTEAHSNREHGQLDLIDESIAICRKRRDWEGVRNGYDERATQALRYKKYDDVEWAINKAIQVNDRLDKPDKIWRLCIEQLRGEYFAACGRWQEAADKLQWTLAQFRRKRMKSNACAALGWLGISLCHLGINYKTGMHMIHKALEIESVELGSREGAAKWLQGLGELFLEEQRIQPALEVLWLCRELREEQNHAQLDQTRETIKLAKKMSGKSYLQWQETFDPRKNEFGRYAFQWGIRPFRKYSGNPIITPRENLWESGRIFNPAAIVHDNKVALFYRAQPAGENQTSRIGLAFSEDGLNFQFLPQPVLAPQETFEQGGGCEDPRIVKIGDCYYLTYTAYDGQIARLAMAESRDLKTWTKRRPVFTDEQWDDYFPRHDFPDTPRGWCKSGAILAKKINGYYWMYFGDTCIWAACSQDLEKWEIIPCPVLQPRPNAFDSMLVEPGPPPVMLAQDDSLRRPAGIWLGYNGAKKVPGKQPYYCFGHVLLDPDNPSRVLRTAIRPLLKPGKSAKKKFHEKRIIFCSGLVHFNNKWLLYYGMDDERIGVAICEEG